MRLSTKLSLATVLGIALIFLSHGYQRIRFEEAAFTSDIERDHRTLAHGLSLAAQTVAERNDIEHAVALLEGANDRESRMQITWSAPAADIADAKRASSSSIERDHADGREWLVTRVPLQLRDTAGVLEMRESLAPERANLRAIIGRTASVMFQLVLLCTVVIAIMSWLFVARPMRELLGKVRRIGAGDLSQPLALRYSDEVGMLAREINAMCDQLESARNRAEQESHARLAAVEQMRHADRLSIVGRLASAIAHELGTPLNVVLAHAHMIALRESRGDSAVADAKAIAEQSERMAQIIRQLLNLSRRETPQKQSEDLRLLVRRTIGLMEPVASRMRVELTINETDLPICAEVDASQMQQVIANLVMNAIQAQPDGGKVTIGVSKDEQQAVIRVQDQGVGIPVEARARVFEPFYTTKTLSEGTGLGLTISDDIVRDHGGRIEIESIEGSGSVFCVRLPIQSDEGAVLSHRSLMSAGDMH